MPKTIASLALIFELLDSGRFEIGLYAITTALCWEKYLISHAKRLYAAHDTLTTLNAVIIYPMVLLHVMFINVIGNV